MWRTIKAEVAELEQRIGSWPAASQRFPGWDSGPFCAEAACSSCFLQVLVSSNMHDSAAWRRLESLNVHVCVLWWTDIIEFPPLDLWELQGQDAVAAEPRYINKQTPILRWRKRVANYSPLIHLASGSWTWKSGLNRSSTVSLVSLPAWLSTANTPASALLPPPSLPPLHSHQLISHLSGKQVHSLVNEPSSRFTSKRQQHKDMRVITCKARLLQLQLHDKRGRKWERAFLPCAGSSRQNKIGSAFKANRVEHATDTAA